MSEKYIELSPLERLIGGFTGLLGCVAGLTVGGVAFDLVAESLGYEGPINDNIEFTDYDTLHATLATAMSITFLYLSIPLAKSAITGKY